MILEASCSVRMSESLHCVKDTVGIPFESIIKEHVLGLEDYVFVVLVLELQNFVL